MELVTWMLLIVVVGLGLWGLIALVVKLGKPATPKYAPPHPLPVPMPDHRASTPASRYKTTTGTIPLAHHPVTVHPHSEPKPVAAIPKRTYSETSGTSGTDILTTALAVEAISSVFDSPSVDPPSSGFDSNTFSGGDFGGGGAGGGY